MAAKLIPLKRAKLCLFFAQIPPIASHLIAGKSLIRYTVVWVPTRPVTKRVLWPDFSPIPLFLLASTALDSSCCRDLPGNTLDTGPLNWWFLLCGTHSFQLPNTLFLLFLPQTSHRMPALTTLIKQSSFTTTTTTSTKNPSSASPSTPLPWWSLPFPFMLTLVIVSCYLTFKFVCWLSTP